MTTQITVDELINNPPLDWGVERPGVQNILRHVFSDLALRVASNTAAPTLFSLSANANVGAAKPPAAVFGSDFDVPDFARASKSGLTTGFITVHGVDYKISYSIPPTSNTGTSSRVLVHSIERELQLVNVDNQESQESLRLFSDAGIAVRYTSGLAVNTNPVRTAGVQASLIDQLEDFNIAVNGSGVTLSASSATLSGLTFTVNQAAAKPSTAPNNAVPLAAAPTMVDGGLIIRGWREIPLTGQLSSDPDRPLNATQIREAINSAATLPPSSAEGPQILFASAFGNVLTGTRFDDSIVINRSGPLTVDLRQGDGIGVDTLFFNLGPLSLQTYGGNNSVPLGAVGAYTVNGFGNTDRLVIGQRVLREGDEGQYTYTALERVVSMGDKVWVELTSEGEELANAGKLDRPNLFISLPGISSAGGLQQYQIENPYIFFTQVSPSAPVTYAGSFDGLSSVLLSNPTDAGLLTIGYVNPVGSFKIDSGTPYTELNSLPVDQTGARVLGLDLHAAVDVEAQWETYLERTYLTFYQGGNAALRILAGAADRLSIWDGESLLDVNPIAPAMTGSEADRVATYQGTSQADIFLPADDPSAMVFIRGGGGNDIISLKHAVKSIVAGGDGFNELEAPDGVIEDAGTRLFTLDYSQAGGPLFAHLGLGVGTFSGGTDALSGEWQNVIGSGFNDTIVGTQNGNELYGGAGDDALWGQQQRASEMQGAEALTTDYVFGGVGNDTYYVELNQFSKVRAHEFAGEGDADILQINGTGAGLWDLASVVAGADDYSYLQNATGIELSRTKATSLKNAKTGVEFASLTRNIEKLVVAGSSDFRNPTVTSFDVAYGNVTGTLGEAANLVLPNISGTHLMNGNAGNDILVASEGANVYMGGADNDIIFAMGGNHRVMGGAGNDIVFVQPQGGATFQNGQSLKSGGQDRSLVHLGMGNDAVVVMLDEIITGELETSLHILTLNDPMFERVFQTQLANDGSRYYDEYLTGRIEYTVNREYKDGEPIITSTSENIVHYFQMGDGDNQFGRMMGSLSSQLLKTVALEIHDNWSYAWREDIAKSDLVESSILDFRADDDSLVMAATQFFVDGPDYISMTFTDGDLVVNKYFQRNALSGNGSSEAAVIHFDRDSGMVGGTLLESTGMSNDVIEMRSVDLVELIGMRGATKPAVEMMFKNAGFLGYRDVSKDAFLIGLAAIDQDLALLNSAA